MFPPHKQKMVTKRNDEYVNQLDCSNHFTMYTYINISHCTPKIYAVFICQFYLNKAGGKNKVIFYFLDPNHNYV